MDLFGDSFKLHDMIDSDIRSLRSEFDDYFNDTSYNSSHLESMSNGIHMDDSEMHNDGRAGWLNGSQLLNGSADFDSIGGLLVNPRTALPVSMSDSLNSSSLSLSSPENSNLPPSENQECVAMTTSGSVTVSLPVQVVTSNALGSGMADVNLTVAVPTPSPSPHTMSSQLFSSQDSSSLNRESGESQKKSKNKKLHQQNSVESAYPKPAYSYSCLIAMALKNSKTGSLPVNEIYDFMTENFPYFKTAPNGWKNSVRHNLSLNKCFEKIEKPAGNSSQRKGYLWAMNPAKVEKMEEELQKWGSKDPAAIRKSMANPERLELIEKGELRNTDSESEVESMNISQVEEEESYSKDEKENEVKVQVSNMPNESMNEFTFRDGVHQIDSCLPELDFQKGIWENLCEDRLQFLSDSPISPLSPKNSETMDDESSLDSTPSSQRSYVHANFIYKCASRASTSESSSSRLLATTSAKDKATTINV